MHACSITFDDEQLHHARVTVIPAVQREAFADDLDCLERQMPVKRSSPLSKLNPFVDTSGLFRVGGQLRKAQLSLNETHPILIPGKDHVTKMIVRHFHEKVCHQGRHLTEGEVRAAGFCIVGGKRVVSSTIFK